MPPSDVHFGRYRVLEPLGRGGLAQAYKARAIGVEGFEKPVVVWRTRGGGAFQERMMADAKRAAFLSHSNIAQVLDVGKVAGNCYVTTEYVTGVSLASLLAKRALSWPLAAHIAIQVANALDYAHARRDTNRNFLRIVHRSVSPHRILLSTAGGVKLTGFGITWAQGQEHTEYEAKYRSPEQLGGEPLDGRSDVYSLALVLRESLSTDRPIEIDHALARALERYPEKRATAGDLRDDLSNALHERGEWVSPGDIAGVVSASDSVSAYAAIDHLEVALQPDNLDPFEDVGATLALYERLGKLCLRAHVGDRGASAMIAGLDFADGVGRDDYVASLCSLLAQLLAQADRLDESREWRERAHQVAVAVDRSTRRAG